MNNTKRSIYRLLSTERWNDSAIFFLRLFTGVMMLLHAIGKIQSYNSRYVDFPDPIGWGSQTSYTIILLIEGLGALCLIAGFLVRPAALALAVGMFVATFFTFPGSITANELSFIYMGAFIALFISGGARYSVDRLLFRVKG